MTDPGDRVEGVLGTLLDERSVLICCGAGGVGKTTTAAALGVAAAERGRRACVVTIDPAKRLADALGSGGVGNEARPIEGPWSGALYAVMLDARGTFDDLVRRNARDPVQAERILGNRLYRNLVSALSGTQEYMATEKLFELHEEGGFDVVIVDTPPTRDALDFLDAPRRLAGFLDNRVFRLIVSPGKAYMRAVSVASQLLLRTLSKVAGGEIVDDAIAFFQAFEGMEVGFRERAERVESLLGDARTAFVLVTAPRQDSIAEAAYFADRLAGTHHGVDVLVVNRVLPRFDQPVGSSAGPRPVSGLRSPAPPGPGPDEVDEGAGAGAWAELVANLEELASVARTEAALVEDLAERLAPAPVVRVPFLDQDVHDLAGLSVIAHHLVPVEIALPGGQDSPHQ